MAIPLVPTGTFLPNTKLIFPVIHSDLWREILISLAPGGGLQLTPPRG